MKKKSVESIEKKQGYRAPALEKGLDILELLASRTEAMTTQQIAGELGRSAQEIFRMLVILRDRQYLLQDPSACYSLSPKLFQLSHQQGMLDKLCSCAQPLMQGLCNKTLQSCHISVFNQGKLLVVVQQDPPYKMRFGLKMGADITLCTSGSGAAALAFCSEEIRESELALCPANAEEKQKVLLKLPQIAQQGYYLDSCPETPGVTNIVYPIFTMGRELFAVISIPFLVMHIHQQNTQEQIFAAACRELGGVANQISFYLGGSSRE